MFVVFVKIVLPWPPDCSHAERNHQKCSIRFCLNSPMLSRSERLRSNSRHRPTASVPQRRLTGISSNNLRWISVCSHKNNTTCSCAHGCFFLHTLISSSCKTMLASFSVLARHCREEVASPILPWHCCTFTLSTATRPSSHFIHPSKINVHLHISPHLHIISWQRRCVRIDAEQSWKIKLGLSQRHPTHKLTEGNVPGINWSVFVNVCD